MKKKKEKGLTYTKEQAGSDRHKHSHFQINGQVDGKETTLLHIDIQIDAWFPGTISRTQEVTDALDKFAKAFWNNIQLEEGWGQPEK